MIDVKEIIGDIQYLAFYKTDGAMSIELACEMIGKPDTKTDEVTRYALLAALENLIEVDW